MESWQKIFIQTHLPSFIEKTTLNANLIAFLLADQVLGNAEVHELEVTEEKKGGNVTTMLLFDKLATRINGYKAIGRATFESKQSGVFLLLLKGLVQYLLQKTNTNLEEETINKILQAECLTDEVLEFFLAKVDEKTLYEDNWIAAPHPLYIPRHISNRIKLHPEIFAQNHSDVFVFTGITRPELSKLAHSSRTAVSSQVVNKSMTTIRFVLLEHEHHWDKLKLVWSETPIHLIHYDRDSSGYVLQNSTRPSEVVSNHVPAHLRDKSFYVPEQQFLMQIIDEKDQRTIFICDTPGMGKTWLLQSLARQLQQLHPGRMIAVICLQKLVEKTQVSRQHSDVNSDNPIKILLKYLCQFQLTSTLLERALENNQIHLELFLDGFDEIPKEHVQPTQQFIKSLAENRRNVRLFITSRVHMRSELERTFRAVAYDILPFSQENQVNYLVRFWQRFAERPEELNSDKLRAFAKECLNHFKKSLTTEEDHMIDILHQCFLLATVNLTNAELCCFEDSTTDITEMISPTSLYDMYTIYFKMGIDRAVGSKGYYSHENLVTRTKFSSTLGSQEEQKLKSFHVWMALQLLLPDLAIDYRRRESMPDFDSESIFACGFLQNFTSDKASTTAMKFHHRTFAEYLVAEHFAKIITSSRKWMNDWMLTKYVRYFVKDILSTQCGYNERPDWEFRNNVEYDTFKFKNSVVVYFLNANLESNKEMSTSDAVSQNIMQFLSSENLSEILSACISSSYANIIRLFKNLLKPVASKMSSKNQTLRDLVVFSTRLEGFIDKFSPDQYYLSVCGYLCHAAWLSNVSVLEELYRLFEECLHENLNEFCSKMPKGLTTPLHYAVRRLDYSMVEFFANQITLPGRRILFSFPKDGDYESQNAIKICELLLTNQTFVGLSLEEQGNFKKTALHTVMANLEMVKFLLLKNANVLAVDSGGNNIAHIALRTDGMADVKSSAAFLATLKQGSELFKTTNNEGRTPLHEWIVYWSSPPDPKTMKMMLQISEEDVNKTDTYGSTMFLSAAYQKNSLPCLKCLKSFGANHNVTNVEGWNALHITAIWGFPEYVEYLVEIGVSLEMKDNDGNTPLLLAGKYNKNMMKCFITQGANVRAVNNRGNNIAHQLFYYKYDDPTDFKQFVEYLVSLVDGPELFKIKNNRGITPLQAWNASGHLPADPETMKLIKQNAR